MLCVVDLHIFWKGVSLYRGVYGVDVYTVIIVLNMFSTYKQTGLFLLYTGGTSSSLTSYTRIHTNFLGLGNAAYSMYM